MLEAPSKIELEQYPGDIEDTSGPLRSSFQTMNFESPALMLATFDQDIRDKKVILYKWQKDLLESLALAKPTSLHPHKFALIAANGSGKDAFIVAPFVIWFILTKMRARVILTSSSGTQLTSQTETYIRNLAELINNTMGQEYFRIRQRYIKCRLSGSEIRMFATDEAGKAEGYHPMVPGAEMAIVVNEGKSVTEEIHSALRRCTGYNYWLEVSTPGEPKGFFHKIVTDTTLRWKSTRVTSYDCPRHLSAEEIEEDKRDLGEHSALFRSKHLALFTSIGGEVIITQELFDKLQANPPLFSIINMVDKIGIDLAAGGDENCIIRRNGLTIKNLIAFRESDTTITADRIERELSGMLVPKDYEHIYADDGGVGHAIIDTLVRRGWKIKRVLNQSAAINKKNFGNKGAENWYRVKRIFEENFIDLTSCDPKLKEQLVNRRYKQALTGARIYLESKKEAKAHGRPSPDRADALILSYTGEVLDDYIKAKTVDGKYINPASQRHKEQRFTNPNDAYEDYTDKVTYKNFNSTKQEKKRLFGSLKQAMRN